MASNKYILRFKEIAIFDMDISLNDVFDKIFANSDFISLDFYDSLSIRRVCQFKLFKKEKDYFFGQYGEIKDSKIQNGVAVINDKEYPNADFKYHVQFLIKYNNDSSKPSDIVFIFNKNALGFETAFQELFSQKGDVFRIAFLEKKPSDLREKIRTARKIKYISVVKDNNPYELNFLFKELYDINVYTTELRVLFRKKKSICNEEIIEYINKRQNDPCYSIAFIDENGVDYVKKFTEMINYKSKKISINAEEISDREFVYKLLKDNLNE